MRSRLAGGLAVVSLAMTAALIPGGVETALQATQAGRQRPPAPAPQNPQRPQTPARPRTEATVPFKVGEVLTYEVSWSSFIVAGTATTTVREKRQSGGSTIYEMVAEGRPIPLVARLWPLYYRMDTQLDSYTLLSHRGSLYAEEPRDRRTVTTQFDRTRNRVRFELKNETTTTTEYDVPPAAQDGIAVFYLLRARGVTAGERFGVPVADSGTLFNAQFDVGALEQIKVPFGTMPARSIRLTLTDGKGELVWKKTELWMSNDNRRLPIKLQAELPIGHFVLALKDVR
jgi:hypothetical protein